MSFAVKIKPSNYVVYVEEGESVLDAAIRQGFDFPYSCRSATCATCLGKVLKGSISYGDIEPYALNDAEQEQGFALFCSAKPTSDLIIEMQDVYGPEYKPAKTVEYDVVKNIPVTADIYHIVLKPATDKKIQYTPGQYLHVLCDDGIQIPFTIANAPTESGKLELYIRHVADNHYTSKLLEHIKNKDQISVKAPYGKVVYHAVPALPIIFVAGGTGVVLPKAILEGMVQRNLQRKSVLYWGVSKATDFYLNDFFHTFAQEHKWFTYVPVLSGTDAAWQGRTGLVHEAVLADHPDLSQRQIYASGPNDMVFAASTAFQTHGLKPHWFYSDTLERIGN